MGLFDPSLIFPLNRTLGLDKLHRNQGAFWGVRRSLESLQTQPLTLTPLRRSPLLEKQVMVEAPIPCHAQRAGSGDPGHPPSSRTSPSPWGSTEQIGKQQSCFGNHQLKQIYIPDAPRNVSGASRAEGRTNSLGKMNGCGLRGAIFFSQLYGKQGSKDEDEGPQWCIVCASFPRYMPSDMPTQNLSPLERPWMKT